MEGKLLSVDSKLYLLEEMTSLVENVGKASESCNAHLDHVIKKINIHVGVSAGLSDIGALTNVHK